MCVGPPTASSSAGGAALALLAGRDEPIGVCRSVAGAAACLAGWVVALIVLSGY